MGCVYSTFMVLFDLDRPSSHSLSPLVFHRGKKIIRVSNDMRMSKCWKKCNRNVTLSLQLKTVIMNDWKRRQTSLIFICKLLILDNLGFHLKMARNWGTQESTVHFPRTWQSSITQYLLNLDVECIWSSHLDVT